MTKKNSDAQLVDAEQRERILLAQILANGELFVKAITYLEKDYFDSRINQLIVEFMKDYYEIYKTIPPKSAILLEVDVDGLHSQWLDANELWSRAYLENFLNTFIKQNKMKMAISNSIEYLADEDYGRIEKEVKSAIDVDISVNVGVSVGAGINNFKEIFDMITTTELTEPTGWGNLDDKLGGGVTIPSLNYLLAKSGGGKSVGLLNLAANRIKSGRDVVYISLELKEEKIIKRFITHLLKIPTYEIQNREADISLAFKKFDEKGYGRFTVQFFQPNSLSAMKLELYLRNYIQKFGSIPFLIVDYAGLMVPNQKGWQGMFERDKYVSEELRGIATMFNCPIWTADQFNRCVELGTQVTTPDGQLKNIEDLSVGDEILGIDGNVRIVLDISDIEEQECFEIELSSGKKIVVSGNHIFPKIVDDKLIEDCINCSLVVGDTLLTN